MTGARFKAAVLAKYASIQAAADKLKMSRQGLYYQFNKAEVDDEFLQTVKTKLGITEEDAGWEITGDLNQFMKEMHHKLIQIEANVRVLNTEIAEIKHRVTGEPVAKISVELEKTSREVADMLSGNAKRKP